MDALLLTVEALERTGTERYRILLTITPPRPNKDADEARKMLAERKLPVFKGSIYRRVAFQKASLTGIPVYAVSDPRAKQAWEDYLQVGKEILR